MKKIFSFVTVAAIVTGAFAFTTKTTTPFCVRNAAGTGCEVSATKMIVAGTPNFKYYSICSGWDGTALGCTGATIANCSVDVRLINN